MEPAMNIDEVITVTKLNLQGLHGYLMIEWRKDSFEMYLYVKDNLWKGRFSPNRLVGFSKNLQMEESEYFKSLKHCLSQEQENYSYEINNGFFYWKRLLKNSSVLEGFLPIDKDSSAKSAQPDLIDILIAMNKQLKNRLNDTRKQFKTLKVDYQKCLRDTEEFLDLKIEMEKALCDKFLNLLHLQKSKVEAYEGKCVDFEDN